MIIKIKNLRIVTIIGLHNWEKETPREIIINLEIEFDGSRAVESDSISDTPDYKTISDILFEEATKSRFDLIEKLAGHLLEQVMQDIRITRAKIEISKPGAIPAAETVSVIEEVRR